MPYTRRKLLKQAALASLAGAASASLSLMVGCKNHHVPQYGTNQKFSPGLRVFFIGAWLFGADPTSDPTAPTMLALAAEMSGAQHKFPYGPWKTFDGSNDLKPNPAGPSRKDYVITVDNCSQPAKNVNDLFNYAATNYAFTYLINPNNLSLNLSAIGIRVIKIPIPTQIITSDFIPDSTVTSSIPGQLGQGQGTCGPNGAACGLAAAHIFDYQGASKLNLDNKLQIDGETDGTEPRSQSGHFHFHTVPTGRTGDDHSGCMFANLLSLINGFDHNMITVSYPDSTDTALEGPYIPSCVLDPELDIPTRSMNTASCGAGGFGLGGGH